MKQEYEEMKLETIEFQADIVAASGGINGTTQGYYDENGNWNGFWEDGYD